MRILGRSACAGAVLAALPAAVAAEVDSLVVDQREDVLAGRAFGSVGPYVKLTGRVFFSYDPANPFNGRIVDLDLAERNGDGLVEAWANFVILRPKFPERGAGTALLEVSNRGGKATLSYFNAAAGHRNPTTSEHFGDGFLMRQGLTVIWVGWQHDVAMVDDMLRSHLPVASEGGAPIKGWVRSDWTVDRAARSLSLGHRANIGYPVSDPDHPGNVLTVRDGREAPRRVIRRNRWRFAREEDGHIVDDPRHVYLEGGFEAGKIYEIVYRAADPPVIGIGPAIIRDMMSYAKYATDTLVSVERGIAIGISQTGRFLRHFVYQGFNTDEANRKVLDGVMIHTAGAGRGSFNHRFAQPSRDAQRYSAFFYPTDVFPFTSRGQTDPETGATDGLFEHQFDRSHLPNIFYTNSGYEYWGRAAALIHTSVDGTRDVELYPNERIYHLASGQHFVRRFPPPQAPQLPGAEAYRSNPLDFLVNLRALLVHMKDWVWGVAEPPASRYPTIAAGKLVPIDRGAFPDIPGIDVPRVGHVAYRSHYGARWSEGIVDHQPPTLGKAFPFLVPQVDELGNEVGGIRNVEIRAPLATYAPWSLRMGMAGGNGELTNFVGTHIPLPRTERDRAASGDPRPSIEMLYGTMDSYLERVERESRALVGEGFLLEEDISRVVARARAQWEWLFGG